MYVKCFQQCLEEGKHSDCFLLVPSKRLWDPPSLWLAINSLWKHLINITVVN